MKESVPDAFIFMKVGNHASENFDAILDARTASANRQVAFSGGTGGLPAIP